MVRIIENYTLYEVIGEGAYGKVYRATNKLDNKQYAVKVIEVKKFQSNKKLQECTVNQINILTNIEKNQYIIAYFDMLKTQNNFYFIYEYCNGGTLQGLLRKHNVLDQQQALLILRQLLEAFKVLNKYNIMHRDLKPDNIFFHNGILKVGDFGFCKSLEKAKMTKTMLGSPIYMAPQILKGQIYSTKADIWSIGVVLYQMLYGFCPFQSTSIPKLIEVLNETQLEFPENIQVSNETKNLMRRILTKDPIKRIQWMELFQQKITNEGKLQKKERLSLVDDDFFEGKKLFRQVSQITTEDKIPSSGNLQHSYSYKERSYNNNNTFTSPKNLTPERTTQRDMFIKKQTYGQEKTTQSPNLRRAKSGNGQIQKNDIMKQKVLKHHSDILKGITVARGFAQNNEKNSTIFTYYILKNIRDRLTRFKYDIETNQQLRQITQIVERQLNEVDSQINLIKNRVEDSNDWKKVLKSKIQQSRNVKQCYQMVSLLSGETPFDNLTTTQMQNNIRNRLLL